MTGPGNYAYAEQLLDMAADAEIGSDHERYLVAKAQVHATLALAAATAMNETQMGMSTADFEAWTKVAGVRP